MRRGIIACAVLLGTAWVQAQEVWPYHESFENGFGRWIPQTNANGYNRWYVNFGPTPSYDTGPDGAHDGDFYCYIEASSYFNQTYNLEASFDLSTLPNPAISFRYHMYGAATVSLQVEVNSGSGWQTVWTAFGQQQTGHGSAWKQTEIILGSEHVSANTQVRFKGSTGGTWTSDISIDDIWVREKQVIPAQFAWSPIEERQFEGVPFPVQVSALDYKGDVLTGFNGPVEITGWSAGFQNSCVNGDFEDGVYGSSVWVPYAGASSPGEYLEGSSVNGSGTALYFKPDSEYDGMSQVVNVSGGERYYVSANFAFQNIGSTDIFDLMTVQIIVDGAVVDSWTTSAAYGDSTYSYFLLGYFDVPEIEQEGTRLISIVAKKQSGEVPNLLVYFDDVSVNFAPEQALEVDPGVSGQFVNGVWQGSVTMNYRLPNIQLIARCVDVVGTSGIFTTYVSAYDLDFDGIVDDWEEVYFTSVEDCDPDADNDGDGYSNHEEFVVGTIPTQKGSHLDFRTQVTGEQCVLNWFATEGCTYDVEWTPNLQYTPFATIAEDIPYPQGAFTNSLSSKGFYRLKVHK